MDRNADTSISTAEELAEKLRAAIARRASLRPGSVDHRRAAGEVRHLQERLIAAIGADQASTQDFRPRSA